MKFSEVMMVRSSDMSQIIPAPVVQEFDELFEELGVTNFEGNYSLAELWARFRVVSPSEFVNEILGLDADADDDFLTNYYDEVEAAAKNKGIDVFSAFDGSVYYFERV